MSIADLSAAFRSFGRAPAPARQRRDPFGLVAGWRAYAVWRDLAELSDAELGARGLSRADLPRIALGEIRGGF